MTTAHATTGNASGAMSIGEAARLRSLVKLAAAHATNLAGWLRHCMPMNKLQAKCGIYGVTRNSK